jgi:hypothetical protein
MMQMADLYLYPICRGRYEAAYHPYRIMQDERKLIDVTLEKDAVAECGIKYSCFELVDAETRKPGNKTPALVQPP